MELLTTYLNIDDKIPYEIKMALQDAMEFATDNVPEIRGQVVIGVDVSDSMTSPVTATTKTRYIDVASLFGACILRKDQSALRQTLSI